MTKESEMLINPGDFDSVDLQINFANTTTQSQIKDGKKYFGIGASNKTGGNEVYTVSIIEFLENGLILDVPSKSCITKHSILIEIYNKNKNPEINFKATAKVTSIEQLSPENDQVEIVFVQKNESEWEALQSVFNKRQEEIREFLNSVKGFEST